MEIVSYMSKALFNSKAERIQPLAKNNIHKLLEVIVDRTNSFKYIDTAVVYPIPPVTDTLFSYGELCFERARELLDTQKHIYLFYSGGLDSVSMFLAFDNVIKDFEKERITIVASLESKLENVKLWDRVIKYNLISAWQLLHTPIDPNSLYVYGENADQLYGSDMLFSFSRSVINNAYNIDTLNGIVTEYVSDPEIHDMLMESLTDLVSKCPLPINDMSDFYWWLNFSSKWQYVAFRPLFISLNSPNLPSNLNYQSFETFFNTEKFQQLSMHPRFKKWGDTKTEKTYKYATREFIIKYSGDVLYATNKAKIGSFSSVARRRKYEHVALGKTDNGSIVPLTQEQFDRIVK